MQRASLSSDVRQAPRASGTAAVGIGQMVAWTAMAATILAGLALSTQFVLAAVRSVGLAWPITHPEGATIAAMLRVRDGEALYQQFQQWPYLITPYPPVQPVVAGLLSRALGLSVLET